MPAAELEDLRLQQGDRCPSPWQLALKLKEDVFDNIIHAFEELSAEIKKHDSKCLD